MDTTRDAVQQLAKELLNSLMPGSGIFGNLVGGMIIPENSQYNRLITPPGMTAGGAFVQSMNNMQTGATMAGLNGSGGINELLRNEFLWNYYRATNPSTAQGIAQAEADLAAAKSNQLNPMRLAYELADPYNIKPAFAGVASNVGTYTRQFGKGVFDLDGQRTAYKLLAGGRDSILYDAVTDPSSYGGFSASSIMDIGKELMVAGQDPTKNTEQFRSRLKEIAASLVPLKDILGEDIPMIMKTLESITGSRDLTDPSTLRSTAYKISTTLQLTGGTIQQYEAASRAFEGSLVTPGGVNRAILGAGTQAGNFLLGTANQSMAGITSSELMGEGARTTNAYAKGVYAENYARALAIYADKNGITDAATANRLFRGELSQKLGEGFSASIALRSLAGVTNDRELERGTGNSIYYAAHKEGWGSAMSQTATMAGALNVFESHGGASSKAGRIIADISKADPMEFARFLSMDKEGLRNYFNDKGISMSQGESSDLSRLLLHSYERLSGRHFSETESRASANTMYRTYTMDKKRSALEQTQRLLDQTAGNGVSGLAGVLDKIASQNARGENSTLGQMLSSALGVTNLSNLFGYRNMSRGADGDKLSARLESSFRYILQNNMTADEDTTKLFHAVLNGRKGQTDAQRLEALANLEARQAIPQDLWDSVKSSQRGNLLATFRKAGARSSADIANFSMDWQMGERLGKIANSDERAMWQDIIQNESTGTQEGILKYINEKYKGDQNKIDSLKASMNKGGAFGDIGSLSTTEVTDKLSTIVDLLGQMLNRLKG